jgi:hypothetical protein
VVGAVGGPTKDAAVTWVAPEAAPLVIAVALGAGHPAAEAEAMREAAAEVTVVDMAEATAADLATAVGVALTEAAVALTAVDAAALAAIVVGEAAEEASQVPGVVLRVVLLGSRFRLVVPQRTTENPTLECFYRMSRPTWING